MRAVLAPTGASAPGDRNLRSRNCNGRRTSGDGESGQELYAQRGTGAAQQLLHVSSRRCRDAPGRCWTGPRRIEHPVQLGLEILVEITHLAVALVRLTPNACSSTLRHAAWPTFPRSTQLTSKGT